MNGGQRFGYPIGQWGDMVDAGLANLEALAARGGHTDYSTFCLEVARLAGTCPQPGDHALAYLLGDIARASYDSRGVVITALVHYKGGGYEPGPGFYSICQDLGLLPEGTLTEDDKLVFLATHQRTIDDAYRRRRR